MPGIKSQYYLSSIGLGQNFACWTKSNDQISRKSNYLISVPILKSLGHYALANNKIKELFTETDTEWNDWQPYINNIKSIVVFIIILIHCHVHVCTHACMVSLLTVSEQAVHLSNRWLAGRTL